MDGALLVLAVVTAVGCGLVGGVFFAFSSFVMPALKRLPPADGIAAMQSINVTAVTPPFMAALFGTAAAALALAVSGAVEGETPAAAAAALYLVGVIGVTIAANVPLNDRLAAAQPSDHALWAEYLERWTAWNHVRTVTGLAASALLIVAL